MLLRPWLFLVAAVVAEIIGVTAMKLAADQNSLLSLLFMYSMIGLSFYLLAQVVLHVPLGLAYALWEAGGLIAVTAIGTLLFGETLGFLKVAGIALLVGGVVLVKLASPEDDSPVREG